jgi:hypothetical protein
MVNLIFILPHVVVVVVVVVVVQVFFIIFIAVHDLFVGLVCAGTATRHAMVHGMAEGARFNRAEHSPEPGFRVIGRVWVKVGVVGIY